MKPLTWREEVVIRILVMIGQIVSEDQTLRDALAGLRNNISYGPWEK